MEKITIRATKLETYRNCPYRYKNEPAPDEEAVHFKFGSALHKYIELRLVNQINEETEFMIFNERWVKQRLMIQRMSQLFIENLEKKWYVLVCSERTNKYFFEDINIELQWTFDHLFKNKEWEYILVDAKTAQSKRTQEHIEGVRQNVIYPALIKLKYWIDVKFFEYWIMTKTITPQFQEVCFEVTWNPEEEVANKLKELRQSEELNFFKPNYPNYSCWYCKLKDQCRGYSGQ